MRLDTIHSDTFCLIASQNSSALLSKCFSSENRNLHQIRDIIPESLVALFQDWKERSEIGLPIENVLPLVELHEIMSASSTHEAYKGLQELWHIRTESLAKTCDPATLGTLLGSRTRSLLTALRFSSDSDLGRDQLSYHLKEHLLYYSKHCRKQNDTQTSLQVLGLYRSHANDGTQLVPPLLGFSDVSSALERLKLLSLQGQKPLATKCLKGLLSNAGVILSDFERATLYGTLGHWVADTKTESAISIMNNYLNRSLKFTKTYGKSHNRLAKYADTHYSELLKDHEPISPVQLELKRYKQDEVSQYDEILATKISDEHKAKIQHNRHKLLHEIEQDQREHDRRAKEIQEFLLVSVENYLLSLRSSSNKWDMSVFRIVSLWFANTGATSGVNQRIARHIPKIPSRKFLVLMYQLSARILSINSEEKEFFNILCGLIEKMAKDHPFHCLYQLIALRNAEVMKKDATSSAASSLFKKLKTQMPNIVQHLEFLSDGYIKLAGDPIPKATKSREKTFSIRPDNPLLRIRNLASIPSITADIPIDDTCQYKNVAGIERFENSYWIPGGINAPKVITCRSSDGQSYRQLVKGNGWSRSDYQVHHDADVLSR
jgi:hypothetical protein